MSNVSGSSSVLTSSSINLNGLGQRYPRIDSSSSLNSSPNHNLETIENTIPSKGDGSDGNGGGRQGKYLQIMSFNFFLFLHFNILLS